MKEKLRSLDVIFIDFDGTLVDTLGLLYDAYASFLQGQGLQGNHEEFDYLNGRSIKEIFNYLQGKYNFNWTPESLAEMYHQRLLMLYTSQAELFPHARSFLQRAFKMGKRLVIVTAAKRNLVDVVLEKEHITRYFEMIVTAEKLEHGKPHPEIYQRAVHLVGVSPERAVAIEDSSNGLKAAAAAGVATIAFNNSQAEGVDAHIQDWHELELLFCSQV